MSETLRVGLVGAGAWGAGAHAPAFAACPGVRIAAVCDPDLARASAVAEGLGAVAYGSVAAMLAAERLEIATIASPTGTHHDAALACLDAGLHVLCEKPLGLTLAEARAMAARAAVAPVATGMGFTMRFAPAMRYLRELVATGALGDITLLKMFLQNAQFLDPLKPAHWKMFRAQAGGGAVVEYGVHGMDLACWMLGPVARVSAIGRTHVTRRAAEGGGLVDIDTDDSCAWLMDFTGGATGLCHAGWTTIGRAPGLELRLFGTKGAVQLRLSDELPGAEQLLLAGTDGIFAPAAVPERFATALPHAAGWRQRFHHALVSDFVERVRGGGGGPDFSDGFRAQQILDAVLRSMQSQEWTRPD